MDLRLKTVCEYVEGDAVCDVGCDHGQLCAELLLSGKVKTAYGIDISKASVEKCKELKAKLCLNGFEIMQGNGFEPVLGNKIDCGVICGIGSNEVIGIIERQVNFAKGLKRLILCPLKNVFDVREFLYRNGFIISDEDMVFEKGRYYNIIVANARDCDTYDDVDIYVGRALINKRHPLIKKWLNKRIFDMEKNISAYETGVKTERMDKRESLERMYRAYKRGLFECR